MFIGSPRELATPAARVADTDHSTTSPDGWLYWCTFICVPIVVFVNPGSRANRRDPDRARRFASILGEAGQVLSPASSDALAAERGGGAGSAFHHRRARRRRHFTLDSHGPFARLPRASCAAGPAAWRTMNVVASSLGIQAKPRTCWRSWSPAKKPQISRGSGAPVSEGSG